jgi:Na+-transporting methylmalonyl-CoA/oxaloacetate decarboxylase gamma subunit
MAVGMSTVFVFLTVLVLIMYASSRLFEALGDRFPLPGESETAERDELVEIAVALAAIQARERGGGS